MEYHPPGVNWENHLHFGLYKYKICSLISAVLFFVLSPGVLLTLPPTHNTKCDGI
jgi:hypothetical protein